jgi:hypothetical protein
MEVYTKESIMAMILEGLPGSIGHGMYVEKHQELGSPCHLL